MILSAHVTVAQSVIQNCKHKAYDTRSDMSYTMVSNGVLGGDARSDILRFCRIQNVVCDKSDRVS